MPLSTPRPLRASQLDPYEDNLLVRWSQGERNAAELYREISQRDIGVLRRWYRPLSAICGPHLWMALLPAQARSKPRPSPRALRWLLTHKREEFDQSLNLSPEVQIIYYVL